MATARLCSLPLGGLIATTRCMGAFVPKKISPASMGRDDYICNRRGFHWSLRSQNEEEVQEHKSKRRIEMPFEEYTTIKKQLFHRSLIFALPITFGGMIMSSWAFVYVHPEMLAPPEELQLIYGLDPMVAGGVVSFTAGLCTFVIGREIYGLLWRLMRNATYQQYVRREQDFLERLAKNRKTGERMSDDYYGDKIKTPLDYLKWLRAQQRTRKFEAEIAANTSSPSPTDSPTNTTSNS